MEPQDAEELVREHLERVLPQRWKHVQAVATAATEVSAAAGKDADLLVAAAWLHDIGYAPIAVDTGFHALDGARFLKRLGVRDRICALVAHHSCAVQEAAQRGLLEELNSEFPQERTAVSDALWYADMSTGPDGMRCTVSARLDEVSDRYGPDHIVSRSLRNAETELLTAASRTLARLTLESRATQPR